MQHGLNDAALTGEPLKYSTGNQNYGSHFAVCTVEKCLSGFFKSRTLKLTQTTTQNSELNTRNAQIFILRLQKVTFFVIVHSI